MSNKIAQLYKSNDSILPAYSGLGAYPIIYLDREDNVYCAECALENYNNGDYDRPVNYTIYWEGPALSCDGTFCQNKMIESAYGDPNEQ